MDLPAVTAAQAHAVYALLRVTPAMIRLERAYNVLYFLSAFLHAIVRAVFVLVGLSSSMRNLCAFVAKRLFALDRARKSNAAMQALSLIRERWTAAGAISYWLSQNRIAQVVLHYARLWNPLLFSTAFVYYVVYTFSFTILWLPFSWYADFVLSHRYGLSHQSALHWFVELGKDTVANAILGGIIAGALLWGIELFPRRWPLVFALLSAPIIVVGIFLDPLFDRIDNNFTPLATSSPLYAPLHRLADRAGVPEAVIYVADKSKQTDETNAYVTGLGSSAQIVLWDTTIKRMSADEVVAIIGHELGHYVEHHVLIGGLLSALAMFIYLPSLKIGANYIVRNFGRQARISSLADPAALPVFFLLIGVYNFATSPIINAASRIIERRADSFGLALTQNRLAMARAQVDLANEDMENPYPPSWEVFWLDDHPPAGERIRFALYGQPMRLHR